ncbi:PIN domain-containing protein [Turneriella parva]|uniref:Ribonuclease VapC n=1 Tax=Turneriella parva (strain ATCC BAA-1111 / DSM 21527 / NCTC 11395 / H) TaxID=869212 RepID=I4BB01_TURPD|nr:PIN domain-containing protein [Turneriella parva]AFM14458.1 PilT protein domain protein [Turneriella parva DSM 21527]
MILLETSALIEAWRKHGRGDAKARVESALRSGRAALCQPVVLELSAGLKKSEEFKLLQDYLEVLPLLPITDEVWQLAATRARLFRANGLTVSNFDTLIFATAEYHNCHIVTVDRHFARMRDMLKKGM